MKIELVTSGMNVSRLQRSLAEDPELWGENNARTATPDSPHYGTQDIWCRWADYATMQPGGSHVSMWYPAADKLEDVKWLSEVLMHTMNYDQLGGVLITRIPPSQQVKPHTDKGWHAGHYEKFAVSIAANEKQAFKFHGEELVTKPGDVFWFDNSHEHWVTNESDEARITLIICMRRSH